MEADSYVQQYFVIVELGYRYCLAFLPRLQVAAPQAHGVQLLVINTKDTKRKISVVNVECLETKETVGIVLYTKSGHQCLVPSRPFHVPPLKRPSGNERGCAESAFSGKPENKSNRAFE